MTNEFKGNQMRAVIYARYSTEMQSEASIEDQVRLCQRLIVQNGWQTVQVYSDMGMSGATHLRPGYQKLQENARRNVFEVVVSEGLDRISRDQEHIAAFFKQMTFQSIPIFTVAEGKISELHIGLKGTMSSLFLKDLALKTRRGMEGRVRKGMSGGGITYGYDVVRALRADGTMTTGERAINAAEATVVIRIYEEFAVGKSPRAIAAMLNREGITGPRATWGSSTIYGNWRRGTGIINNELYVGKLTWNRQRFIKDPMTGKRQARMNAPEEWIIEDVPDQRIVDQDLWDRVKARQGVIRHQISDSDGPRPERARRARFLFSGLMTCGCCGGGYTLVGRDHFGCASSRNKGTCENRLTIKREELESRVLTGLRDQLLHPDLIATFVAEYQKEYNDLMRDAAKGRRTKEKELAAIIRQIDQIITAITEGMYHASMKAKMTELENRKALLTHELAGQEEVPLRLHPGLSGVYRQKVSDLTAALNAEGTKAEAAELLRGMLSAIRLIPEDGSLAIELVGELASIMALGEARQDKTRLVRAGSGRLTVVAGVGFEPTTFRL